MHTGCSKGLIGSLKPACCCKDVAVSCAEVSAPTGPTFELPEQAVLCPSSCCKGLLPLALAALRQLPHHAAQEATQLEAAAAADIGVCSSADSVPAGAASSGWCGELLGC
jgi:hypothetical protein